ncbi:MAG TPA: hypothetical protein GX708_06380 [Gallicola sp.]|nr:hypothetical protein [Gallicola sp.]
MGTSSIFDGPVKNLLPNDYDDLDEIDSPDDLDQDPTDIPDNPDEEEVQGIPYRWKDAKDAMTRYVKGSSSDRGKVMSRYVRASGGSNQLSRTSTSGKNATINLGRVIQAFRDSGVGKTLKSLQIDFVNKSAKEVLSELVNVISSDADSKEDIAARGASIEAISELYDIVLKNDGSIESLSKIDENTFRKVIEVFVSEYIFIRVMGDLQSRFEQHENNPKESIKKEKELKSYITTKVELRLKEMKPENHDYHSSSIEKEINDLYKTCFRAFEEYI